MFTKHELTEIQDSFRIISFLEARGKRSKECEDTIEYYRQFAYKRTSTFQYTLLILLEIALMAVIAIFQFKEIEYTLLQIMGVLILVGIIITTIDKRQQYLERVFLKEVFFNESRRNMRR